MEKSKQFSYVFLTINPSAKCFATFKDTLQEMLQDNPNLQYSYIMHNADEEIKNEHYHVIIYSKGKKKRFSTWVSIFEGAHVEEVTQARYKRALQYLLHKNDPQKEQYKLSQVTSNIPVLELQEIMASDGYDFKYFNPDMIYEYLEDYKRECRAITMELFVKEFGLNAIKPFYFVIKDIIQTYNIEVYNTYRRHNLETNNPIDILWKKIYNNLKVDYQIAIAENLMSRSVPFEDFAREEYLAFIGDVEKGYHKDELLEIEKKLKNIDTTVN